MTKPRAMPGDDPTEAELRALSAYSDGAYKNAATAALAFGIMGRRAGNFGATVRRCYEKGFLSFRWDNCYAITSLGQRALSSSTTENTP